MTTLEQRLQEFNDKSCANCQDEESRDIMHYSFLFGAFSSIMALSERGMTPDNYLALLCVINDLGVKVDKRISARKRAEDLKEVMP